jgi:hypothetical protein
MRRVDLARNNRTKTGCRQFRAFLERDMAAHPERLFSVPPEQSRLDEKGGGAPIDARDQA